MIRFMMVKARSMQDLDSAQQQIEDLLRQRHRIGPHQQDDFTVKNLTQMMQTGWKGRLGGGGANLCRPALQCWFAARGLALRDAVAAHLPARVRPASQRGRIR